MLPVPELGEGGAGAQVAVVWLPGRRAGLEVVEKLLTSISFNRLSMRS
jgi:hypothetical protein